MEFKDFFEKLSSYNIFNHLLPGALFSVIGTHISNINFSQSDILSSFFVYYFIGVIISRVGSIVVEPFLKIIKFIKFAPYDKYIVAAKNDSKIDTLSETNNMYRTSISLFFCLLALKLYMTMLNHFPWISEYKELVLFIALMIMFSLAYKKQTNYIKTRVEKSSN